jgi:hypothetical protein
MRSALLALAVAIPLGVTLLISAQQRPAAVIAATTLTAAPIALLADRPALATIEQAWAQAAPLNLRLSGGLALTVQVRAVYSPRAIYFWLRWPDNLGGAGAADIQQQRSTVTWRRATTIGGCAVVCHASSSAGARIDNVQVVAPDVDAQPFTVLLDQWRDGWWTLGYSRPLQTGNPVDIQFTDLRGSYHFGLDVARGSDSAHSEGEDLTLRFGAPSSG